ncbi:MAG: ferritin family protein [Syntrophomonadaceae bacterium]|nr:ferritin family protein [Syntrophomonadaceae bacterium]
MRSDYLKGILNMAIAREIEAAEFYFGVYEKTNDTNLKEIFKELAQEEHKHQLMLEGYQINEAQVMKFKVKDDYKVAETVEAPRLSLDMKPVEAIALAMKREEEAMNLYQELADASDSAEQKEIFENLSRMEQSHKVRLEDLYTNMAFPEVW